MHDLQIHLAGRSVNLVRFLEIIPNPFWFVDQDYRLLLCNSSFRSLAKTLSGRDIAVGEAVVAEQGPKSLAGAWKEYYNRALLGESFGVEVDASSGGKDLHIDFQFHPVPADDGEIIGVAACAKDITEKKLLEKAFQEEAARFRAFFEHNPDAVYQVVEKLPIRVGIGCIPNPKCLIPRGPILEYSTKKSSYKGFSTACYSMDSDGRFLLVNRRAEEITGYSLKEFLGMPFPQVVAPHDLSRTIDHFRKTLDGERQVYEVDYVKRDGTPFRIHVKNFPMVVDDRIVGVYGIAQDVSERIALQNRLDETGRTLRLITDNMSGLVSLTDMRWIFRYATPSHKRVLGYDPDVLLGKHVFDFLHPAHRARVENITAGVPNLSKEHTLSVQVRHADGHYVWLDVSASPILDESGNAAGAIFSSTDATERRFAEQAVTESEEKYRQIFNMESGMRSS